jgi:hypothetical protein
LSWWSWQSPTVQIGSPDAFSSTCLPYTLAAQASSPSRPPLDREREASDHLEDREAVLCCRGHASLPCFAYLNLGCLVRSDEIAANTADHSASDRGRLLAPNELIEDAE